MIGSIWARLQLLVAKGSMTLFGADKIQVKILDGETLANIERVEPYGFSSHPKAGAQTYIAFPSGDRSYGFSIIIGDKRYQMALQEGEVALHDDHGNYVAILNGGIVKTTASTKVIAQTPLFETSGDAHIGGNLTVSGQTSAQNGLAVLGACTANGVNIDQNHTHTSTQPGTPTSGVN